MINYRVLKDDDGLDGFLNKSFKGCQPTHFSDIDLLKYAFHFVSIIIYDMNPTWISNYSVHAEK